MMRRIGTLAATRRLAAYQLRDGILPCCNDHSLKQPSEALGLEPFFDRFALVAAALLNFPDQFLDAAAGLRDVVVRDLTPLAFDLAAHSFQFSLDLIAIHETSPF